MGYFFPEDADDCPIGHLPRPDRHPLSDPDMIAISPIENNDSSSAPSLAKPALTGAEVTLDNNSN